MKWRNKRDVLMLSSKYKLAFMEIRKQDRKTKKMLLKPMINVKITVRN